MGKVSRMVRTHWRPAAVMACLLGMFWPVTQQALFWLVVDADPFANEQDWIFRSYFVERYLSALVLGLIVARWWIISAAGAGVIAAVVATFGSRQSAPEDVGFAGTFGSAWSVYLEAALPWLWIAGLIALGIILSRQLGGLRIPPNAHP